MLPENETSSVAVAGLYLPPDDRVTTPLSDWELGGIALNDPSQGLMVRNWRLWLDNITIKLAGEGSEPIVLFEQTQITELALCFDQNMRYTVAYIHQGVLKLLWWDSVPNQYVTTVFTAARNPKMTLDDKRQAMLGSSDMILAYIRDNTLLYRQQRDRFAVEYVAKPDLFPSAKLKNIGMSRVLRLQFELV